MLLKKSVCSNRVSLSLSLTHQTPNERPKTRSNFFFLSFFLSIHPLYLRFHLIPPSLINAAACSGP